MKKVDAEAREIVREAFMPPVDESILARAVERGLVNVRSPRTGIIEVRRGSHKATFPDPLGIWERLVAYFGWDE